MIEWSYPSSWSSPFSYFPLTFQIAQLKRQCKRCDNPCIDTRATKVRGPCWYFNLTFVWKELKRGGNNEYLCQMTGNPTRRKELHKHKKNTRECKCCVTWLRSFIFLSQTLTVHSPDICQLEVKRKIKTICIRAKDALCNSQWSEWSHLRSVPASGVKWETEPVFPLEWNLTLTLPANQTVYTFSVAFSTRVFRPSLPCPLSLFCFWACTKKTIHCGVIWRSDSKFYKNS